MQIMCSLIEAMTVKASSIALRNEGRRPSSLHEEAAKNSGITTNIYLISVNLQPRGDMICHEPEL